ncbi:URC4/urg3 family protein [Mycolicibacterium sp. BiH015]|uniref:URC4/urg3 family protein n=1 Tax=Mycolicibacterium sp. BiH015 TaxID=3018808 RepID=UPI0022E53A70|nr:URC4/urg3 family protein [Mycolicibacterium sp. BiH015]MDA2890679.1 URC4/urg3 family protein [Mycolicibacterium sp. BiH015]
MTAADERLREEQKAAALLRTTAAVRQRSGQLLERARAGDSRWFTVDDAALGRVAEDVAALTRERFPDLDIPYHSRWRHFEVGGVDRKAELDTLLDGVGSRERARAMIDLTVVSVLLDAGAGAEWGYVETRDDVSSRYSRSEGLGVATWHGFVTGGFSSDPSRPLQVDANGLRALSEARLAEIFQVTPANPLVGLDGRLALMHRLGDALAAQPDRFGEHGRPGGLFDVLAVSGEVHAHDILTVLLSALSSIWLSRNSIEGIALGDCWRHEAVQGPGLTAGWMPFHKLTQWLTYSLIEPFEWAGVDVLQMDALTGLPEYRNGGLLLDGGVLALCDRAVARQTWEPGHELVVEWRALTVALLDELAPLVRTVLGVDAHRMPLACVLEGGTWAAGRASAHRLRNGLPPLTVDSDGTVF